MTEKSCVLEQMTWILEEKENSWRTQHLTSFDKWVNPNQMGGSWFGLSDLMGTLSRACAPISTIKSGSHHRPNDEVIHAEPYLLNPLDSLWLVLRKNSHAMLTMVKNSLLPLAPIVPTTQQILDIGAGTGIWCIGMGDMQPSADNVGVDIGASMHTFISHNVSVRNRQCWRHMGLSQSVRLYLIPDTWPVQLEIG